MGRPSIRVESANAFSVENFSPTNPEIQYKKRRGTECFWDISSLEPYSSKMKLAIFATAVLDHWWRGLENKSKEFQDKIVLRTKMV
jgi:hypothetical protein